MSEIINLNDTTPAAPAGSVNVKWQKGISTDTDPSTGLPIYPASANVSIATTSTLGLVEPDGTTVDIDGTGKISVPKATSSALGLVKPDNSSIMVDATGTISASGGGSGSTIICYASFNNGVNKSATGFAMKGVLTVATQNVQVAGVFANVYGNTGDSYQALIYEISGTSTIASIVGSSSVFTFSTPQTFSVILNFGSPLRLTAGTTYGIVIQITSGTGATPCLIDSPGGASWACLGFQPISGSSILVRHAGVNPTVGTTLTTTTGAQFMINLLLTLS